MDVFISNQLETFGSLLQSYLMEHFGPLDYVPVIVPSHFMGQWLELYLMRRQKVSANMRYFRPEAYLNSLIEGFFPERFDRQKGTKDYRYTIFWIIYSQLCKARNRDEEGALSPYFQWLCLNESSLNQKVQLAWQLVDLFERYMLHRPRDLVQWVTQPQPLHPKAASESWQYHLWRAVCEQLSQLGLTGLNKAQCTLDLIKKLEHSSVVNGLPKAVCCLQLGPMPEIFFEILRVISRHCPVLLMGLTPFAHEEDQYALQILHRTGSIPRPIDEFMQSLGEESRALLNQLYAVGADPYGIFSVPPASQARLSSLQTACLKGVPPPRRRGSDGALEEAFDPSLTLNFAPSALREVEILHDRLLELLERFPEVTCRDILIVVPDLKRYAPYLRSVFGASRGAIHLPVTLPSMRQAFEEGAISSFMNLLNLLRQSNPGSGIFALLQSPLILAAYEITENEGAVLQRWVAEFFPDWTPADPWEGSSGPEIPKFERLNAILRPLLTGVLVGSGWTASLQNQQGRAKVYARAPLHQEEAELVGRFAELISQLQARHLEFSNPCPASIWKMRIERLATRWFAQGPSRQALDQWVAKISQNFLTQAELIYDLKPLDLSTLILILAQLEGKKGGPSFGLGAPAILCTEPMCARGIPFEIIAVLGLNEGVYPAEATRPECDLLLQSPRDTDYFQLRQQRGALLDFLNSARRVLYLSAVKSEAGQEQGQTPSESLEYLLAPLLPDEIGATSAIQYFENQHPSLPFLKEAFQNRAWARSFAKEWFPESCFCIPPEAQRPDSPTPTPPGRPAFVSIQQLVKFFDNPVRAWRGQNLRAPQGRGTLIWPHSHKEKNFLQRNRRRRWMLQAVLEGAPCPDDLFKQLVSLSYLPDDPWGHRLWSIEWPQAQALSQSAQEAGYTRSERWNAISLPQGGVKGILSEWGGTGGVCTFSISSISCREQFYVWLKHLLQSAGEGPSDSLILGWNGDCIRFLALSPEQAKGYLNDCLSVYHEPRSRPLLFFLESAFAWLEAGLSAVPAPPPEQGHFQGGVRFGASDSCTQWDGAWKAFEAVWTGGIRGQGEYRRIGFDSPPVFSSEEKQNMAAEFERLLKPLLLYREWQIPSELDPVLLA